MWQQGTLITDHYQRGFLQLYYFIVYKSNGELKSFSNCLIPATIWVELLEAWNVSRIVPNIWSWSITTLCEHIHQSSFYGTLFSNLTSGKTYNIPHLISNFLAHHFFLYLKFLIQWPTVRNNDQLEGLKL